MRWAKEIDGHNIEIMEHMDMGGGVEEIIMWCHTCDEKGTRVPVFGMEDFPKWRLAFAAAVHAAEEHAKNVQTP